MLVDEPIDGYEIARIVMDPVTGKLTSALPAILVGLVLGSDPSRV